MRKSVYLLLFLSFTQTGCGIGGHWMNGNPFNDRPVKSYSDFWEKEGMTKKNRRDDWTACGGNENGTFSWKVKQQLPDETDKAARMRQEFAFQRCMIRSGYRYTGNCSSEYMKARPLCGAP